MWQKTYIYKFKKFNERKKVQRQPNQDPNNQTATNQK